MLRYDMILYGMTTTHIIYLNCGKSTDRSHAQLLLNIVSPWRSLSHTLTHTHTHSNVVHQDVPALYDLCMHGRLMVLRVHTNIMGSRGYLVFRHAIMAQEDEGTLECNIVLLCFPRCPPYLFLD